eukprot:scaffold5385_cov207-Skeletonema_dohrnii-CCMP3373.AAC.1
MIKHYCRALVSWYWREPYYMPCKRMIDGVSMAYTSKTLRQPRCCCCDEIRDFKRLVLLMQTFVSYTMFYAGFTQEIRR